MCSRATPSSPTHPPTTTAKAQGHKFDIDGTTYTVKKTMNADPRRIGQIDIVFNFPAKEYDEKQKALLWAAAESCPVGRSLHPDVIVNITMNFQA